MERERKEKKRPAPMYFIESGEAQLPENELDEQAGRRVEHALINVLLHIEFIYDKLSSSSSRSHSPQQSCIWPSRTLVISESINETGNN